MLTYSKNAWHYRLVNWVFPWFFETSYGCGESKTNLCPYVRAILASLILAPWVVIWRALPDVIKTHPNIGRGVIIYFFLSHGVAYLLNHALVTVDNKPEIWWLGWGIFFGGIITALVIIGLVVIGSTMVDKINDRRTEYRRNHPKDYTKDSTIRLVADYVEAKHENICPCIVFKDENS